MPGVIGTQVTVRWRLGDPTIDMVSESGRLVATHRKAPRGLGRVVRLPEHTSALVNAVLAAFTTKRPCKPKPNRPPTTAKTRKPRTANRNGPHLPIEDEVCCLAFASVTVDLLDSFQRIPYGTLAWKQSYGRRNIIEKANSMLKDKGGLNAGWCRAFGLAAQTIGALALTVVHNLKELKRFLGRQKRNGTVPKPALNGTGPANPAEEEPSGTLSTRGPP